MSLSSGTIGVSVGGVFACLVGYNTIVIEPLRSEILRGQQEISMLRRDISSLQTSSAKTSVVLENLTVAIDKLADRIDGGAIDGKK